MLRPKVWFLIGLLGASCVVPDVEVVPDPDDDSMGSSGKSTSATGGKTNSAGNGASPVSGSPGEEGGSSGESPGPILSGGTGQAGSGASGGSGPTPPAASAVGKFCHDIWFGGQSITLTLSIGTGSKRKLISAASGTCQPISGNACTSIPVGTQIPVTLLDGSDPIVTYPADIVDGASWLFLAYTDGELVDFVGNSVTQEECELGLGAPAPSR